MNPTLRWNSMNVFLYYPNLIGYLRILCAFTSFIYMPYDPVKAASLYMLNVILDEFDGFAARKFNQCSEFGARLDIITDSLSSLGLVMFLSSIMPQYMMFYQMLVILDVSSQWLHDSSELLWRQETHRQSTSCILRLYYSNGAISRMLCITNELFLIGIYLHHHGVGPNFDFSFPPLGLTSSQMTLPQILMYSCFPLFFIKTAISAIQLVKASISIVDFDTIKLKSH